MHCGTRPPERRPKLTRTCLDLEEAVYSGAQDGWFHCSQCLGARDGDPARPAQAGPANHPVWIELWPSTVTNNGRCQVPSRKGFGFGSPLVVFVASAVF
jgi:hypothetical protein